MPVTSHEVARLAGVSQPTVSRALRDDPRVSERTKQVVREAAAQLGYVRSEAGRTLSSGRTRRIALLVTDLENQFYVRIIAPVHRRLATLGYQLTLQTESSDDEGIVERLVSAGVDGVVLATPPVESVTPIRLRDRGIPFVYFNRTSSSVEADAVVVTPDAAYDTAAQRAAALGHRRAGAILGPVATSTARARETSLRHALTSHGIAVDERFVRRATFDSDAGEEAMQSLLAENAEMPSLLFCANDLVAFGALNTAHRAGVAVPGRVSVVGFDDLPAARWPVIDLATIACDYEEMARVAAELIVERIDDFTPPPQRREFVAQFVERGTLGPAAV
ncbi:LacI family transcriptional regulator [Microbacterium trichothecenolyticum]|uniref:LacI family transcriptional regulator n=1 Tax=Microbacterium trichothecenolyticum TaxID=69370 RepID=A0ABU0TQC1_MICTR|nr:LacI family transcriptional regulator [Microbacterium trichothecenolyticum]